ncbi:hypothetical protein KK083_28490 [Fulvivirgaceae bacterium PWU4]|uniref:Uncharacterized protein n=1 Tax=Chryseosolibacter histidini TaxID=2782349 RepID=A0AAP2DSU1_9BACT|nr:hypothetical protein [Chryseosolibacter histidini]MBT1700864.1 hypothetical protein [Chryseosolibacter histidini]
MPPPRTFSLKKDWPRLLLLYIALVIANYWFATHITMSLMAQRIVQITSAFFAVLAFIAGFMNSQEEDDVAAARRNIFLWCMDRTRLMYLYSVLAVVILFVSSVTLEPEEEARVNVSTSGVIDENDYSDVEKSAVVSFPRLIWPWGSVYYVNAIGYMPDTVRLYPWNTTFCTLKREPIIFVGILARPGFYKDVKFSIIRDDERVVQANDKTSLLISTKENKMPTGLVEMIKTKIIKDLPLPPSRRDSMIAVMLDDWQEVVHHTPGRPLVNGDRVIVHALLDEQSQVPDTLIIDGDKQFYVTFLPKR